MAATTHTSEPAREREECATPVRAIENGTDKRTAAGRVLSLLGAFGACGGALTLSEISRHAKLSMTTTHRLVHEVLDWGGLEVDPDGKYRLSRTFLLLASTSTRGLGLRERALPHLVDLHRATGLTVHLAARDRETGIYLEALRAHPNYTGENRIGGRLPLHATATGQVMLAFAPEPVVQSYVSAPLKRYTDETITEPDALLEQLAEIRRRKYLIAGAWLAPNAGSVAAPVFNPDGTVDTAVGVVYLLDQHDPNRCLDLVRMAARRITNALAEGDDRLDPRTIDFNRRRAGLI